MSLPVLTAEAKSKDVMSMSDLAEDELREHLDDEAWGDYHVSSHHVSSRELSRNLSMELSLVGRLND